MLISLLDTPISIPTSARTPEDTIAAIATEIRQAKGVNVGVDFGGALNFNELYSGKNGPASQVDHTPSPQAVQHGFEVFLARPRGEQAAGPSRTGAAVS